MPGGMALFLHRLKSYVNYKRVQNVTNISCCFLRKEMHLYFSKGKWYDYYEKL